MGAKSRERWILLDPDAGHFEGFTSVGMNSEEMELKRRAEASFEHAEYRLENHVTKFDRIDAILALKRAMQTRLEQLNQIYEFKQYPQASAGGWLSLLEDWGAIRQRMLKRMNQLRNAVEHDGAEPPSL